MYADRIRPKSPLDTITTPARAVAMSGFTKAVDAKAVPLAMARQGQTPHILEEALAWHVRRLHTGSTRA